MAASDFSLPDCGSAYHPCGRNVGSVGPLRGVSKSLGDREGTKVKKVLHRGSLHQAAARHNV